MTRKSRSQSNSLRIIGGEWRSRLLHFPDAPGLRPTPDRVRETLFNWLQWRIHGASCLDLFSGSGALGFEALSRGAAQVVAVEQHPDAARAITSNARLLGSERMQLVQTDALRWLRDSEVTPFDVVFLDPPYAAGLQEPCCAVLAERGWVNPGALIYVEAAKALSALRLPPAWSWLKEKRAGDVHYGLCQPGSLNQSA